MIAAQAATINANLLMLLKSQSREARQAMLPNFANEHAAARYRSAGPVVAAS